MKNSWIDPTSTHPPHHDKRKRRESFLERKKSGFSVVLVRVCDIMILSALRLREVHFLALWWMYTPVWFASIVRVFKLS